MAGRRPSQLGGFSEFRRCRPEPDGLREVYFRYDDELEYWAKANNFATEIKRFSGTKIFDFPVVLSGAFRRQWHPCGHPHHRATRAIPRASARKPTCCAISSPRATAATAGTASICRPRTARRRCSAPSSSSAARSPSTATPSPTCRPATSARRARRRLDPRSGRQTEGQFESFVRFELTLAR